MANFYTAQICLNGHVIDYYSRQVEKFCSKCGSKTITMCPTCNTNIRGMEDFDVPTIGAKYELPSYCPECGTPYPWTQSKLDAMKELIDFDDELSSEEKSYMSNNIKDLTVDTPKTKVVATKFNVFLHKAGSVTASAIRDILVDIASETAKKIIFNQ